MIYVSSECIQARYIVENVKELASSGFRRIELSGGTSYYNSYLGDLLKLKKEHKLEYLVHNYFPPPEEGFVLNLASLSEKVRNRSVDFCKKAIEVAAVLGAGYYSVHAGFYFDPEITELGKVIKPRKLYPAGDSIQVFIDNFKALKQYALAHRIKLYLENNVVNLKSFQSLNKMIPAMLLTFEDARELGRKIDFNLLLDVGHLKVTAQTLGLDFQKQFSGLFKISDYLHLSDNNGLMDEHGLIFDDSMIYKMFLGHDLTQKTFVLETHGEINDVKKSYVLISNLLTQKTKQPPG
ncbi:MAG: sugar phosphate isomerase/epimerase [Candidatus Omnitrophica bacterium]|nr:sugar phosphate isomerase/epimerase [Candidatus Omnitrophota bacterium]